MKHRIDPRPQGFALLTVLIAVGIMAGFVAAYGRHVVVEGRGGMASPQLLASREACHSGVRFARQMLVSGADVTSGAISSGDCEVTISVVELPGGHQAVQVESLGQDGLGARRQLELGMQSAPAEVLDSPASLPTLSASVVSTLLADQELPVTHFTESQTLQGVELTGLLVVHSGVDLALDDVIVHGAFVSAAVMDQDELGDYDVLTAPRVVFNGNVRIDPHPSLPGVAVLMPDGAVSSGIVDARVQIHGDVVAHDVVIMHQGVLSGNVAAVQEYLAPESMLDRLGIDRRGTDWSSEIELGGAQEPEFLAAVPPSTNTGALSAIIGFWQQQGDS